MTNIRSNDISLLRLEYKKNASSLVRNVTDGLSHDTTYTAIHLNYIDDQTTFASRILARDLDKDLAFML